MLSRTADNLFWLSRYIERGECLARILETTQRLASLPTAYGGKTNEWESAVETAGVSAGFFQKYEDANHETVVAYLAFDRDNPSSILNCFETARHNARSVRTALTMEMWEAINGAWIELRRMSGKSLAGEELSRFLGWVKEVGLRFDGSASRTMLRNDIYDFSRLGMLLERADNTARILDVKYHLLLPDEGEVGGGLDYYQWSAILRAVSAATSYHWVYRQSLKPWLVADLLILNDQMPRSLAACYGELVRHLDELARAYGQQGPAQRTARGSRARLENAEIKQIFQQGLHEFIEGFIVDNNRLGVAIHEQYLA